MASGYDKTDRSIRLLKMFDVLQRGSGLNTKELQREFGITSKSVQRDIGELRMYINDAYPQSEFCNIEYSKIRREYFWRDRSNMLLDEKEILLIATILLESRGLTKDELEKVIGKMLVQCSAEAKRQIDLLIKNERFYYKPTRNAKPMGEILWQLSKAKEAHNYLQVTYKKVRGTAYEPLKLMPLAIMFSEMYFYLIARVAGDEKQEDITFRVDRIGECETLAEKFSVDYLTRFQEGIFRQEIQFMTTGELMDVKFRFWGKSLEAVLDRLSNAEILEQNEKGAVIRAKVYKKGAKMWFLSQAEYLEVLEPAELRAEMETSIQQMLANYRKT